MCSHDLAVIPTLINLVHLTLCTTTNASIKCSLQYADIDRLLRMQPCTYMTRSLLITGWLPKSTTHAYRDALLALAVFRLFQNTACTFLISSNWYMSEDVFIASPLLKWNLDNSSKLSNHCQRWQRISSSLMNSKKAEHRKLIKLKGWLRPRGFVDRGVLYCLGVFQTLSLSLRAIS